MDDIVKAAIKKWPNVPHCYGWLGLDARGDWYLRDAHVQAEGPFPQAKGSRVTHDKLREFIGRNYEHDARGAWFFQNGPQRVYVQLEAAPLVLGVRRVAVASPTPGDAPVVAFEVETHIGERIATDGVQSAWLDEHGRLFLATSAGLGVVRSMDMDAAADAIEVGLWTPEETTFVALTQRFAYLLDPQPPG